MARQWVQQYEEGDRLINKYVDDETGEESFEDAGPVQKTTTQGFVAPVTVSPPGGTQVSTADYLASHEGFNPYASTATASGTPSAVWTPPPSNPYRPDQQLSPSQMGPTPAGGSAGSSSTGPSGGSASGGGENWVYDVDAEGYEVRRDPSRGIPNQRTGRWIGQQGVPGQGAPPSAGAQTGFPYAEYFNQQAADLDFRRAAQRAQEAYNNKRLELLDLPMLQVQKDRLAFEAATQAANQALAEKNLGLGVASLVGSLRGPANAFAQQNVLHGLNSLGLNKAFDALKGTYAPAFTAPQTAPQPVSLANLGAQVDTGGMLAVLPDPNKIVGRNFLQLPKSSQDFALAAFEAKGYDPGDVLETIKAGLPQFSSQKAGFVAPVTIGR